MNIAYKLYRLRFRFREWLPWAGPFPVHVDIELAGKCQLACTMCPYGTGAFDEGKQGMMDLHVAYDVLYEAWIGGASSIKLNFRGEPGLSPHLVSMVLEAKRLGFTEVAINTNLTAFSLRRLRELAHAGLDLMIISIDGATKGTYEKIRVNGDFNRLISNLLFLRSLNVRPRIRLQIVEQDANRHEINFWRRKFADCADELVVQKIRQDNTGKRKRCPQPWQRMVVMWDGQVGLCCSNWNNEAVVGNIEHETLGSIWRSPAAKALRKLAKDPTQGDPCLKCRVGGSYK